tara:strand:+ start:53 stop:316 length:264 start_codon:yes stop_codon:yes gene_type:complete
LSNIKIDINSIFPIIINIINESFVDPKRLLKLISDKPYKEELVVFVKVRMDNLNEFSKLMLSKTKRLERINTLIKKEINIRKDKFTA